VATEVAATLVPSRLTSRHFFLFFLGSAKVERLTASPRQIAGCRIKLRVEERKLQVSRSWGDQ